VVDGGEKAHGVLAAAIDAGQELTQQRTCWLWLQIRSELLGEFGLVLKGVMLGIILDEEVEGIDHRHVGDQVHGDGEFGHRLREHHARNEVAERILHPVQEMGRRQDRQ